MDHHPTGATTPPSPPANSGNQATAVAAPPQRRKPAPQTTGWCAAPVPKKPYAQGHAHPSEELHQKNPDLYRTRGAMAAGVRFEASGGGRRLVPVVCSSPRRRRTVCSDDGAIGKRVLITGVTVKGGQIVGSMWARRARETINFCPDLTSALTNTFVQTTSSCETVIERCVTHVSSPSSHGYKGEARTSRGAIER